MRPPATPMPVLAIVWEIVIVMKVHLMIMLIMIVTLVKLLKQCDDDDDDDDNWLSWWLQMGWSYFAQRSATSNKVVLIVQPYVFHCKSYMMMRMMRRRRRTMRMMMMRRRSRRKGRKVMMMMIVQADALIIVTTSQASNFSALIHSNATVSQQISTTSWVQKNATTQYSNYHMMERTHVPRSPYFIFPHNNNNFHHRI